MGSSLYNKLKPYLFTYETPKMIELESKFIGIINIVMQLILLVIIIVWIFILQKGYQHIDNSFVGGFNTKLKGVARINTSDKKIPSSIWDPADFYIPPQDTASFFLLTNVIITRNQQQTTCVNSYDRSTHCHIDENCAPEGEAVTKSNGFSTGACNTSVGYCELHTWCPTEDDSMPNNGESSVLEGVADFTVFIKNNVYFPYFKKGRSNLIESVDGTKLSSGCFYHPEDDPYCPIFRIDTIVGMATRGTMIPKPEEDKRIFNEMAVEGGSVSITVQWDCNFDYPESACKPTYVFSRLDVYQNVDASKGFNFRYPVYYMDNGTQKRQLLKAFGIVFLLNNEATARAFDPTTCLLNIGSSLGLLGISKIVANMVLLNIHRHKAYFKKRIVDVRLTSALRKAELSRSEKANGIWQQREAKDELAESTKSNGSSADDSSLIQSTV